MSPVITASGAAESGKRNKRKGRRAPRKERKGERWRRRVGRRTQPISLKQGLIIAYVSTNEIPYFVIVRGLNL